MKIYNKQNVFDATLDRIRYLFDEFPNVIVGFSGGKDSTVCFNLSMIIAKEKKRLPLNVMWIDQEGEWQGTVDFCEKIMTNQDVKPYWFQMPMVISNNASSFDEFFYCWAIERKDEWIHQKHELSIKENCYGTDRFHDLFKAILAVEFSDKKTCYISGVRTNETPKRFVSLTHAETYKGITWGSILDKRKQHYTFYPIYDWSFNDVWKAIYDNRWEYNVVYDELYRYGASAKDMRISSIHHETSKQCMQFIQVIEPNTWERITATIIGSNTIGQLKGKAFTCPNDLPAMFCDWREYAYYLCDNIIQEEKNRELIKKKIEKMSLIYVDELVEKNMFKEVINCILASDFDLTKIVNFELRSDVYSYRKYRQGKKQNISFMMNNQYIPTREKIGIWDEYEKNGRSNKDVC